MDKIQGITNCHIKHKSNIDILQINENKRKCKILENLQFIKNEPILIEKR